MNWRKDSTLTYGSSVNVELIGGHYDAIYNLKFCFLVAFTTMMLRWVMLEFGRFMNEELENTKSLIR